MPTTVAGFKALLASDRAAVSLAKKQHKLQIAALKHALSADTRAEHRVAHQLAANRHKLTAAQKRGDASAVTGLTSAIVTLMAQEQQLAQTSATDRANLAQETRSTSAPSTVKQKLVDDTIAFVQFRRDATKK